MIQAFQGYSEGNGQFTAIGNPLIPKGFKVYILVADEAETKPTKTNTLQQILANLQSIKEGGFTEDDIKSFARWDSGEYRLDFEERLP